MAPALGGIAASRRPRGAAPLAAVLGPTGTGKSELAMAIAAQLPVEIIAADSRQVYRGMDIGTAKPSAAELRTVRHHLLDVVDAGDPFTVADWLALAMPLADEVAARGNIPLLVGGTGLYVSALIDGYVFGASSSPELRARLATELETAGVAPLAERLAALDPAAAAQMDLRNPRRVLRALERVQSGGSARPCGATPYPGRLALVGISRPRAELYRRIDRRAEAMFAAGLVAEVQALLARGHAPHSSPLTSHGYAEAVRVVEGALTLDEAVASTARRTRQHARRQLTWFRRDGRIVWIAAGARDADDRGLVGEAVELIRRMLG